MVYVLFYKIVIKIKVFVFGISPRVCFLFFLELHCKEDLTLLINNLYVQLFGELHDLQQKKTRGVKVLLVMTRRGARLVQLSLIVCRINKSDTTNKYNGAV